MRHFFDIIREHFSHNRGLATTLVIGLALTGCAFFPFKATSPTDGSTRITREQLNTEIQAFVVAEKARVDTFYAKAEAADAELGRKEAIATIGLEQLNRLAAVNGLTGVPTALAGAMTLIAGGLAYDNRRKDTRILLEQRTNRTPDGRTYPADAPPPV